MDSLEVQHAASRLRSGIPCTLADESPRVGGTHHVFKLIFEDCVQWAARVSNGSNWNMGLRAVELLKYIRRQRPEMKATRLCQTRIPRAVLGMDQWLATSNLESKNSYSQPPEDSR
jgi:uncharacterized membrane protein